MLWFVVRLQAMSCSQQGEMALMLLMLYILNAPREWLQFSYVTDPR